MATTKRIKNIATSSREKNIATIGDSSSGGVPFVRNFFITGAGNFFITGGGDNFIKGS
jgi:hypothetical protein